MANDDPNFVNQARLVAPSPDFSKSFVYENHSCPSPSSSMIVAAKELVFGVALLFGEFS
jgi:hypothetical protein